MLLWPKNTSLNFSSMIGVREGGVYKVPRKFIKAIIHDTVNPCSLWHRRFGHLHFQVLPGLQKMVKGMPVFQSEHDNVCRGCALGKNIKKIFPTITNISIRILELIHTYVCF